MRCGARRAEFSGRAAGPRRRVAPLFSSSPLTSLPLRRPSPTLPRSRAGRPRRSVRPSLSAFFFLFFVLPCSPAGCADASVASCGARFAELATPLPLPASPMVWSVVSVSARTLDTATLVRLYFLLVGIFSTRVTLPSPVPISLRILWLQTVWYHIHPIWNPPHSRTVAIVPNRSDCVFPCHESGHPKSVLVQMYLL